MEKQKIDFTSSKIELILRDKLAERDDLKDRILSGEELGQYIEWLITNYGENNVLSLNDLKLVPCSGKMTRIAKALFMDHENTSVQKELLSIYDSQREESFFAPDIDISVSKQLRYMPAHWHSNDYFEFYYNIGSGNIRISFPEEDVTIRHGSILIVTTSAVHACQTLGENDDLLFFMIRSSTFRNVFWNQLPEDSLMARFFSRVINAGGETSYLHFETYEDEEIESILTAIYYEYLSNEPYKGKMLNAMMTTFFILLLRKYEDTVKLPRTKDFYWSHRFSALLSYIETNYTDISLKTLSEKFHYSEKQISRIVQKYLGVSYNRLILDLKMKRASYLLTEGSVSIEEVSQMVGYSTASSFYRAFSSYYGVTPSEYRSRQLQGR